MSEDYKPPKGATVSFGITYTKHLGDFEGVKIHVGASSDCDGTDVEDTYARLNKWVNNKLNKELRQWE